MSSRSPHLRQLVVTSFALLVATTLAVASYLSVGAGGAAAAGPPTCATDCATAFAPPIANGGPFGISRGPLGSVYFSLADAVARLDQHGQMTVYPLRAGAFTGWLTSGPASDVWFAERRAGRIGVLHADGSIREYTLPTSPAIPQGIVFAPDGNIYVTEQGANAIARIDPVTGAAMDMPVPTPNATVQSGALGPDGAVWFIERSADKVGQMTLDGHFTEYTLQTGSFPNRIVAAPDDALWFTELHRNMLGRITTNGQLTEYPLPGGPVGITVGKDNQLYVALVDARAVARVNLDGDLTGEWPLPGAAGPLQITTGFGLDLWITDTAGGNLYRLTPYNLGR